MTCNSCVHSKMIGSNGSLRCTRYPPVPILVGMTDNGPAIMGVHPTVQPAMTCGEWKQEPVARLERK